MSYTRPPEIRVDRHGLRSSSECILCDKAIRGGLIVKGYLAAGVLDGGREWLWFQAIQSCPDHRLDVEAMVEKLEEVCDDAQRDYEGIKMFSDRLGVIIYVFKSKLAALKRRPLRQL
jgi:hypothetical protein